MVSLRGLFGRAYDAVAGLADRRPDAGAPWRAFIVTSMALPVPDAETRPFPRPTYEIRATSFGINDAGEICVTFVIDDGCMRTYRIGAAVLGNLIARGGQVMAARCARIDQRAKALSELAEMDAEHI